MKKVLPAFLIFFLLSVLPASAQVVINEFAPNADPEWVEFYNASDSADYLKSYYLDDDCVFTEVDETGSAKKILTNLNTNNINFPYFETTSYIFNNGGDYVVLFDNSGNLIDQYQYTSDPGSGISIGRHPDQTGAFELLSATTKGQPNFPVVSTPTPIPTPTTEPIITNTPIPTPTISIPTPTFYLHQIGIWKCEIIYRKIRIFHWWVEIPSCVKKFFPLKFPPVLNK